MVVFGEKGEFGQKFVVFGQSGCIRAKVIRFGQKWLFSDKVVVFGQSGCIREKRSCIWA